MLIRKNERRKVKVKSDFTDDYSFTDDNSASDLLRRPMNGGLLDSESLTSKLLVENSQGDDFLWLLIGFTTQRSTQRSQFLWSVLLQWRLSLGA